MQQGGFLRLWPALFFVAVCASFLSAFMWAEDAFLLFNRYNDLVGAKPWVVYNGYVSLHPHVIAWLASHLPISIQPFVYAATTGSILFALLVYVTRITERPELTFLIVTYLLLIDRVHFVNLTFSLWSSTMFIGAVFLFRLRSSSKLSIPQAFAVFVFQFASPITVAMVPLIAAHAAIIRDRKSWFLTVNSLAATLLIVETGGSRTDISLSQAFAGIASLPMSPFLFQGQFPGTGVNWPNAIGLAIFLVFVLAVIITTYTAVARGTNRYLWLFNICILGMTCIYFLTPGFAHYPAIAGRYVFPATIALAIGIGLYLPRLSRGTTGTVVAVGVALALVAIVIRWDRTQWGYAALTQIWSHDRNADAFVETAPISRQIGASLALLRSPVPASECVDVGAEKASFAAKAYCGDGKYHLFGNEKN